MATIKPFKINIPQADLDDLQQRLASTRYANELPNASDDYGVKVSYVKKLVDFWHNEYDWRKVEAQLNALPQFTTEIDGQNIHFVHVKSNEPNATPIILTHGWPTTFVEYIGLIDRLTNPQAHGGKAEDAFHVVIPSVPGVGFSGPTHEPGWNKYRIARAWKELMHRLDYDKYIAAGNDGGSLISPEVGRVDEQHVLGVHVTQIFSFPNGTSGELEALSPEERKMLEVFEWFTTSMNGYEKLQQTKPQNLAHAIADSPSGQLAWSGQLFGDAVSPAFIITNVIIYWLTNTGASAARWYYEDAHATEKPTEPTTVPMGLANFGFDFQSIRAFADRDHKNIISWNKYTEGGHFASEMTPDLLVEDIRGFAAKLRNL